MIVTKLLKPHRKDCGALGYVKDGLWSTPWSYFKEDALYLDSRGGKRGTGHRWLISLCNVTDCPGKIMIREKELINQLPTGSEPVGK